MTITPSEATIIAADSCTKAAAIKLGFVDRFSGSVIIVGSTSNVESALNSVITTFYNKLGFDTVSITMLSADAMTGATQISFFAPAAE